MKNARKNHKKQPNEALLLNWKKRLVSPIKFMQLTFDFYTQANKLADGIADTR